MGIEAILNDCQYKFAKTVSTICVPPTRKTSHVAAQQKHVLAFRQSPRFT
jgi:hypothetical protein